MTNAELIILMAEDDEGHAYLVRQNLREAGVTNHIAHVRNGQEALDFIHCRGAHVGRIPGVRHCYCCWTLTCRWSEE